MTVAYIRNVSHLPRFEYFQLPENVRPIARQAILDEDRQDVQRQIENVRLWVRTNIHHVVNNPHLIASVLRRLRHIRRTLNDLRYFESYIDQNVCNFLGDGTYIHYMPR